jgi:hypothetical protein
MECNTYLLYNYSMGNGITGLFINGLYSVTNVIYIYYIIIVWGMVLQAFLSMFYIVLQM